MKKILSLPSSIRSYVSQISLLSLYPLLLAIYPIVFLYSHNISELTLNVIYVPILVAILITSLVMLVANLLVKNWHKTALIVALSLLVFYFYQPLVLQLPETLATIGEISLTRGKVFLPLIALAYLVVVTLVVKTSWQGLAKTAQPLNLLFAVLIGFSLFQIGQIEITRATNSFDAEDAARSSAIDAGDMSKPDIYYFVFDRYAGQKTLNDYYEFDNSPFLNELTSKGFYVAENSHTNYPSTELSIASSLSMDYHESRAEKGQNMDFTTDIYPKIWNSQAISYFKDLGYKYYQVSSRYMPTSYSNIADEQFIPKSKSKLNLDEFTVQLLQSTVINVFGNELLDQVVNLDYYDAFLNAHNYQRTIVPRIIEKDGPKVVFTHVLLPHDPHVVNKDCETIDRSQFNMSTDLPAYLDQLQCANKLALEWVDGIMKQSKGKAIILLQADEGPYPMVNMLPQQKNFSNASVDAIKERTNILNAYYFPDKDYSQLYSTITPVNSFRTILRQYFDMDTPNLEDKLYVFPSEERIFEFIDVTSKLN